MSDLVPSEINAGVTFELLVTLTAHPAPDWALALHLRGPGNIDLTAAADGSQHRFSATAEETGAWLPGAYWYVLRATSGAGDVAQVCEGQTTIKADLAAIDAPFDGRSHVEKVLSAIEAVIEGRASKDQERYRINNRELYRTPIRDLLKLRSDYRDELRRIKAAARGNSLFGRKILVTMK